MPSSPRREEIVETAAALMNRGGYVQTSVSELLAATGLEKGGLYHHFRSKEELALAAFDLAHARLLQRTAEAVGPASSPREQIAAAADAALDQACGGTGGCPMIRLALDAGERHPALRARAAEAMQGFREMTRALLRADPPPGADPDALGDVIVALVEGGIVVADVTGDPGVVGPIRLQVRALLAITTEGAPP